MTSAFPAFLLCLSCALHGCATNGATGALAGSALSGGAGGLLGGVQGALVGTAVGAVGGGLIGLALDSEDQKMLERSSPRTLDRIERGEPLTLNDVIKLSEGGVSEETIIEYLKESHTTYQLTSAQVRRLQAAGVGRKVIDYLLTAN
jgi:uncharacterized protein YcfJ